MQASNYIDILLIEDNPADIFVLKKMLHASPLHVNTLYTTDKVADAQNALKDQRFHVALLDLTLPDSYGLDTYLGIKSAVKGIPVIILTGYNDADTALEALKQGAQDYLVKGNFNADLLTRAIQYSLERKKAEEALLESEEKYKQLFYQNFFPSWIYDADSLQFLEVNDAAIRKYGYERNETERITLKRNIIKISASYSGIKDDSGRIVGISVIERKIMLRGTMESKAQALLETAPDAMVIVNSFGQIILTNVQTEKLFGYKKDELLGQDVEILIPGRFLGKHTDHRKSFFANAKTRPMGEGKELFGQHKTGREFPVEISLSPLETEDGLLVSAAIRDISEKKKLENQIKEINIDLEKKVKQRTIELETKNKELEQFAYVASHDLQEPLRTTASFVGFLKEEYYGKLDGNANNYLDYISQASDRMQTLIKDLLDYSRIGRKIVLQEVDCNIILSDVLADLSSAIENASARVVMPDELPVVKGYATELKLLFQNLISNSIKFHRENVPPEISITGKKTTTGWEFSVKDNGIGIEKKHHERIFIIFQRLHNRMEYDGSGIGLSHCKKIVELHGGKLWVDSELGKGSNFQFNIQNIE